MNGMGKFADKEFDVVFADVQYGIGESKKVRSRTEYVKQKNGNKLFVPHKHKVKNWDDEQPTQDYFDEIFRVGKKHIIFGENYLKFAQKDESSGRIFWDKVNGGSDFSDGELLWTNLFTSVRQIEFMWNGFCQAANIRDGRKQQGNKKLNEVKIHPTQKPVQLYKWLLMNYVKPGSKLLDTHSGSGSFRIACYDLGYDSWSYELDKEYYDGNVARYNNYVSQGRLELK